MQGNQLSSLLLNSVLLSAMKKDVEAWRQEGFVVKLDDNMKYCISKLRIADDVISISNSLHQLWEMMTDVKRSNERQG